MYAVIEVGAKQYKVETGDVIEVEKLEGDNGKDITLDKVLLVSGEDKVEVGTPYLKGAKVAATLVAQTKAEKVVSFKYRRRKSKDWTKGHRQKLTTIKIGKITL